MCSCSCTKMKYCRIVVLSIIGLISISAAQGNEAPLGVTYKNTQDKLDNLQVSLNVVNGTITGDLDNFIDNVTNNLKRAQAAVGGTSVAKVNMDKLGELLKKAVHDFERTKGNKKKRVLKDAVEVAKGAIGTLGKALKEFTEAVKPVKGKVAEIAMDLQKAVGQSADKLMEAVKSAG